jgi:nicotinamide mononucleotide adenylyltransferase
VLLTTGALNPVHLGHVAMFDKAHDHLGAEYGLEVVGGFLSPSHDMYLARKFRPPATFYPATLRLDLCRAATESHPFLAVGAWEAGVQGRWPDFPEVTSALTHALSDAFATNAPAVLYLCGEDHLQLTRNAGLPGVCVVARKGRAGLTDLSRHVYAVPSEQDDPLAEASSTRVRKALLTGDDAMLRADLHPAVYARLRGAGEGAAR